MPKLTYTVAGEEKSVEMGDSCSIGRIAGNTIVLEGETGCSRRHCQIIRIKSGFEIADLGSTNGTKVNGRPVKRHKLVHGDRIEIGDTVIGYVDPESVEDEIDLEEEISLEEPGGGASARASSGSGGGTSEQCYFVFAGGDKDGEKVLLDKPRTTFGRKTSNTVQLGDTMASGYHCEVVREGGAYMLRDLGSTNGTLLDRDPVAEVALQHGGRVRMGGTLFVFVDPTVEGFEKAMATVDDLGSEWGLLRAEMDMDRVQKARRSQAVMIGGLLVLVVGGGWLVTTNPELLRGKDNSAQIEVVAGNKVEDFSFEEGLDGWTAVAGSPATGAFGSNGGKQGDRYFTVSRDGPKGPSAVAHNPNTDVTVRPGKGYRFGAFVRGRDGAQAAVRVLWIGAGSGDGLRWSASPLVGASDWTESSVVVTSPGDATKARLELVNVGGGAADFDDLFFVEDAGGASTEVSAGNISVTATPDGAVSIFRDGQPLLLGARVASGVFPQDSDPSSPRTDRVGVTAVSSVSSTDGGVTVKGRVLEHETGQMSDFQVTVTAGDGGTVSLSGELPGSCGLVGVLPASFVKAGVGVFTKSGSSFRLSETRIVPNGIEVTFGDLKRFNAKSTRADTPFGLALFLRDGGYEFAFGGGGAPFSVQCETDSAALKEKLRKLWQEAQAAEQGKRYGEAIARYGKLVAQYPEGNVKRKEAEDAATRLKATGEAAVARLQHEVSQALAFKHVGDLRALRAQADEVSRRYAGNPLADRAATHKGSAQTGLDELEAGALQVEAAPVLARAEDFRRQKNRQLARVLYQDVVIRFGGTQAAKTASEQLAELDR